MLCHKSQPSLHPQTPFQDSKQIHKQNKKDIVFWLDQSLKVKGKKPFNLADWLGKFYLKHDSPDKWVEYTQSVIKPDWLQIHPREYLPKMLKHSKESIIKHKNEGVAAYNYLEVFNILPRHNPTCISAFIKVQDNEVKI